MKRLLLKLIFIIASFFIVMINSNADTIVLKNGNKIEVDNAWEEGDLIKANKGKGTIGYPKDAVESVIYEKGEKYDSFEFDIWKAGIKIEKAFKMAESNNIPLAKSGGASIGGKFNPNVYKDMNKSNVFHYHTKLMGKHADVSLCFTPTSRLMHKVIVSLSGVGMNKNEFKEEILTMLKSKYGNKIKYSKQLFGDTRIWNVNKKYTVSMIYLAGNIKIEYADNVLALQNTAEKKKIIDKKKKEYTEKDSHKF